MKLDESSEECRRKLHGSNLAIAKGQGYYESATDVEHLIPKPIVYILQAKCTSVAETPGVPQHGNLIRVVT